MGYGLMMMIWKLMLKWKCVANSRICYMGKCGMCWDLGQVFDEEDDDDDEDGMLVGDIDPSTHILTRLPTENSRK